MLFYVYLEGATCKYPNDPEEEGMGIARFDEYKEINNSTGLSLRRAESAKKAATDTKRRTFVICQKVKVPQFNNPEKFKTEYIGTGIRYDVPSDYDPKIIEEMDKILSSLEIINLL